jgi:DNA-binding SARP family transcriptional activator
MSNPAAPLAFWCFGAFEALRNGESIPTEEWKRRKTLRLLKLLLIENGRVVTEDQLIEALYGGESPARKRGNLRGRVGELRRVLEPDLKRGTDSTYILRSGSGYRFNLDAPCWIDLNAFDEHLSEAKAETESGNWGPAVDAYHAAVDLYRGDLLEEEAYEEWTLDAREDWRERYLTAREKLAEGLAELGEYTLAIASCQTVLRRDPAREGTIRRVMTCYYRAGEQAQALDAYEQGATALQEYLGVDPSDETRALYESIRDRTLPGREATLDPRRVAVIPFNFVGGDEEQHHLAEGLTDTLISALSSRAGLRVIARTSMNHYRETSKTAAQIGKELRAGWIVEGSVQLLDGQMKVTAKLLPSLEESPIWSKVWDAHCEDALALQAGIADAVGAALRRHVVLHEEPAGTLHSTENVGAYSAYLKGRFVLGRGTQESLAEAQAWFEAALALEPDYAHAWAGLADALVRMWWEGDRAKGNTAAKAAASRAIALDPALSEAHSAMASVQWLYDLDPVAADMSFRRALELNPNDTKAHRGYAHFLENWNRMEEAASHARRSAELDPFSLQAHRTAAWAALYNAEYHEAVVWYRNVVDLDPRSLGDRLSLAGALQDCGDWDGAEAEILAAMELFPRDSGPFMSHARHLAAQGRLREALDEARHGLALAPASLGAKESMVDILIWTRQYQASIDLCEEIRAEQSTRFQIFAYLAVAYLSMGREEDALREMDALSKQMVRTSYMHMWADMFRGVAHAQMGNRREAYQFLAELIERPKMRLDSALAAAWLLAALDEHDKCFAQLRRAIELPCTRLRFAKVMPGFDPVRDDPRFDRFLERLGLPPGPPEFLEETTE